MFGSYICTVLTLKILNKLNELKNFAVLQILSLYYLAKTFVVKILDCSALPSL